MNATTATTTNPTTTNPTTTTTNAATGTNLSAGYAGVTVSRTIGCLNSMDLGFEFWICRSNLVVRGLTALASLLKLAQL